MLSQCLARTVEILAQEQELRTKLSAAESLQERVRIRREWCQQATQFLNESEKVRYLVGSFRTWGIG
jgi:hypothetical protein